MNHKHLIRDTFSNYGYTLVDNAADDPDAAWFKREMENRYIKYTATGGQMNGVPEYRLEGPHAAVFNVVLDYWDDGSSEESQLELLNDGWVKL